MRSVRKGSVPLFVPSLLREDSVLLSDKLADEFEAEKNTAMLHFLREELLDFLKYINFFTSVIYDR